MCPEGASIYPAKGGALVTIARPTTFVRANGPTIYQTDKRLALWAEGSASGGFREPGLRPSLDKRLGLRPELEIHNVHELRTQR